MSSQLLSLHNFASAVFEVFDVKKAMGFGLHVAAAYGAAGDGKFPEFFLLIGAQASARGPQPEDRLTLVYLDGERRVPSSSQTLATGSIVLSDEMVTQPGFDPGTFTLTDGTSILLELVERGSNRIEVDLGRRSEIQSVAVTLTPQALQVKSRCLTEPKNNSWPRQFQVCAEIPLQTGDLSDYSDVWISDNGLLSSPTTGEGRGSGFVVALPHISTITPIGEDVPPAKRDDGPIG